MYGNSLGDPQQLGMRGTLQRSPSPARAHAERKRQPEQEPGDLMLREMTTNKEESKNFIER